MSKIKLCTKNILPFFTPTTHGSFPRLVQALRIPLVASPASSLRTASRSSPPLTAALSPESRAGDSTTVAGVGVARLGWLGRGLGGSRRLVRRSATATAAELALDKRKSLLAVLVAVLLVVIRVVARAAVRVLAVAVVLDAAAVGGAGVTPVAGGETLRCAGAHVVGEAGDVAWGAHQDDSFYLLEGGGVDEGGGLGDG